MKELWTGQVTQRDNIQKKQGAEAATPFVSDPSASQEANTVSEQLAAVYAKFQNIIDDEMNKRGGGDFAVMTDPIGVDSIAKDPKIDDLKEIIEQLNQAEVSEEKVRESTRKVRAMLT